MKHGQYNTLSDILNNDSDDDWYAIKYVTFSFLLMCFCANLLSIQDNIGTYESYDSKKLTFHSFYNHEVCIDFE